MRNLTLDLDALVVDSFSTSVAGDPSQWTAAQQSTGCGTYDDSCAAAAPPPVSLTNMACCA
jgi:hypothetical protein